MSIGNDDCERCSARVRTRGDHLCPPCAAALGRDVGDPFWGDFHKLTDVNVKPLGDGWHRAEAA